MQNSGPDGTRESIKVGSKGWGHLVRGHPRGKAGGKYLGLAWARDLDQFGSIR